MNEEILRELALTSTNNQGTENMGSALTGDFSVKAIAETITEGVTLTAQIQAYYSKNDTSPISTNGTDTDPNTVTLYKGQSFWYKITVTNATDTIAQRVKLILPQPTSPAGISFTTVDDVLYGVGNANKTIPEDGANKSLEGNTVTIGTSDSTETITPDNIPATSGTDGDGVLIAWVKATVATE